MNCRVCGFPDPRPLDYPANFAGPWFHCEKCGSDSSAGEVYAYDQTYQLAYDAHVQNFERSIFEQRTNLDWFGHHAGPCPNNQFLDVGCADGAALVGMSHLNWRPFGFDINPAAQGRGYPLMTAPQFNASYFGRDRFGAILCREVIEHVPEWSSFLIELARSCAIGGLLQIQTPRPCSPPIWIVYQASHLQIFSPGTIEAALQDQGFEIIESRTWEIGQNMLARKIK